MADTQAIMKNAREWLVDQDVPIDCPNCNATNRWETTEVAKVNRFYYDKEIGATRAIKDPELYLVHIVCRNCGHIQVTYAEEVPLT